MVDKTGTMQSSVSKKGYGCNCYHLYILNSINRVILCLWRSNCQERRVVIPLPGITMPHICSCPKPGPGFPTSYNYLGLFFLSVLWNRRELIVRFGDIGGIVDLHWLNFFFIIFVTEDWFMLVGFLICELNETTLQLLHSDTLSWFQANLSMHLLLNAVCLGEKQQIPIL